VKKINCITNTTKQ